jgi:predicted nuclease with TOPRIM domain
MSSLKEKAKTLAQIIKINCPFVYLTRCKDCIGRCEFEGTESFAGLWVRLEDADQEIEKVRSDLRAMKGKEQKLEWKLDELLEKLYDKVDRLEQDLKALEEQLKKGEAERK